MTSPQCCTTESSLVMLDVFGVMINSPPPAGHVDGPTLPEPPPAGLLCHPGLRETEDHGGELWLQ